jgi:hypothetical protein
MPAKSKSLKRSLDVVLYYPNIIGYLRVLFMGLSFYFAFSSWKFSMMFCKWYIFEDIIPTHGYLIEGLPRLISHANQTSWLLWETLSTAM